MKSPVEIPLGLLVLLVRILAVLLLVAVLYALYRRFRQQPPASPIDISAPLRRPYEVAYDQLRELEASGMLERGENKEYYIRVSEIIRAYVEAQYYVPALEMASFEVLEGLGGIGVDHETLLDFEGFLAECDLVKFAKYVPDASRARQIVPRARKLVERTKVGRPAPVGVAAVVPEGAEQPEGLAEGEPLARPEGADGLARARGPEGLGGLVTGRGQSTHPGDASAKAQEGAESADRTPRPDPDPRLSPDAQEPGAGGWPS